MSCGLPVLDLWFRYCALNGHDTTSHLWPLIFHRSRVRDSRWPSGFPYLSVPYSKYPDGPGMFDFLGFTFYWGISLRGYWVIKKKTAKKRLSRFKRMVWDWCKKNRHKPLRAQHEVLCSKLRGYYQYFGVRCNFKAIATIFHHTKRAWRYWLCRRSHKGNVRYEHLETQYPLPRPRIVHDF